MEGAEPLIDVAKDWIPIDSVRADAIRALEEAIKEGERHTTWEGDGVTISCPTNIARHKLIATDGTRENPIVVGEDGEVPLAIKKTLEILNKQ